MLVLTNQIESFSDIDFREGAVILINKPLNWTSFDVVNKIRYLLRKKYDTRKIKVGHNGTLDPLATGLVMIFTGKYTKRIPLEEKHDKRYQASVKFGATTASLDREEEEIDFMPFNHITFEAITSECLSFIGDSEQIIPSFSATKIKGRPMYKMAREGLEVPIKKKSVTIYSMNCTSYSIPYAEIDIHCSKGTYVRAIARDLGQRMGTSAYLYGLERTHIANYDLSKAFEIDNFCNLLMESI